MEDKRPSANEESGGAPVSRARLRGLRRVRLPEILMAAGLVLIAVAGVSHWTQANSDAPAAPAVFQPTSFPTSAQPTAATTLAATPQPTVMQETSTPAEPSRVALPTIPRPTAAAVAPAPAKSVPNRIVITSIEVDAPVVEVGWVVVERDGQQATEWEVADYAAGFHMGSAYPGNPGNTVLSGHNNMKGKVFRYLVNIAAGDEIVLYADGNAYSYRVESVEVLPEKYASDEQRAKNAELIGDFPDERLTLVSCWPYTSNTHRVIVIARPVLPSSAAR